MSWPAQLVGTVKAAATGASPVARVSVSTLLAAVGIVVLCSPPAFAHNGVGAAFADTVGPYTVYAYDGLADKPGALLYSAILKSTATGLPVDGASVTVTATLKPAPGQPARRVGPVTAEAHANVYQYELPDPGADLWLVHLAVHGTAGGGEVSYLMHGTGTGSAGAASAATGPSGNSWGTRTAGGVAALAVLLLGAVAFHRRPRPRP